ncbi:MAG: Immunoglobulin subtype [Pedosphaera sp.]|nr:Immunoglobulin subtype [Pedosphaera sp.]
MNKPQPIKSKIAAGFAGMALLFFAGSTPAALVTTTDHQEGTAPVFTPSWVPDAANSLINGLAPSSSTGDFNQEFYWGNRTNTSLTIARAGWLDIAVGGASGFNGNTTTNNYVSCGGGAGNTIVYTLPSPGAYGYNLTNIAVYGGWGDGGRADMRFSVSYATIFDTNTFIPLTYVDYNPSDSGKDANRVIFSDSGNSFIAPNVAAVKFDFTTIAAENNWAGIAAITIGGTTAAGPTNLPISTTYSNQLPGSATSPSWTIESDSLIRGMTPTTTAGNFAYEGAATIAALTDSTFGNVDSTASYATGGNNAGTAAIYTLTNSANGSDITNIVIYSGWADGGRDGQCVKVSYSTVAAPSTYTLIASVFYNPTVPGGTPSANRVQIHTASGGPLAQQVYNVKFDFTPQSGEIDNGFSGYAELIVEGQNSSSPPPAPSPILISDTLPGTAHDVVGGSIAFTAVYSNLPPANLQWQVISGGVTNDIIGQTNATLTLASLQLTDSGSYQLKAVNATNGTAAPSYSTPSALSVSNVPAAVGNIITTVAGQTGLGSAGASTNFYPTWIVSTNNDLIYGSVNGSGVGTWAAGAGNFGADQSGGDPAVLSDGSFGYFNYWPNVGSTPTEVTCGTTAGNSITYTLNTNTTPLGYDLTNIVVYGGWGDNGRDEQEYTVYYSTVSSPNSFQTLQFVQYNPSTPNGVQSATRVALTPVTGALAQHVAAVKFDFNILSPFPKNGYEGYSEIIIAGKPSLPIPTLTTNITPLSASDVVGGRITMYAAFTGYSSLQWQKNGTNIPGATTATLVLNNLQLSDTAVSGGYALVASNASGTVSSSPCALTVNPVPAAVTNVITAIATQTRPGTSFAPTWDATALSSSLIYQASPSSSGSGDFTAAFNNEQASGPAVLTDGTYGVVDFADSGNHASFACIGPGRAGKFVTYALIGSANGYNLTNISVSAAWNDGGRDGQGYTVYYSTVANPTTFIPLAGVSYDPVSPVGISWDKSTLTPAAGSLAQNVAALMFDFSSPAGETLGADYSGYSEISVYGSPSSPSTAPIVVTATNENTATPDWVVETNSLIENQPPSSVGTGAFAGNFNNEAPTEGLPALTDGTFGPSGLGITNFATCGGAFGAGSSATYVSGNGWNLTNIVVYSGWSSYDRDGQFYNITYSTVSAPATFVPLVTVTYNPTAGTGPSANRVEIAPGNGATTLATNVYAVKFDFTPQTAGRDNGYSGYAEIVLQGSNLAPATPPTVRAPVVSGTNLVLTGTGGTANRAYTWLSTTNLLVPLSNWTTNATGVLDGNGAFSNAIPINPSTPANFFRLRMP